MLRLLIKVISVKLIFLFHYIWTKVNDDIITKTMSLTAVKNL